jgi:transposase
MAGLRTSRPMQDQVLKLFLDGHKIRKIQRSTGLSRNTVRAIIRAADTAASSVTEENPKTPTWVTEIDWERLKQEHSRGVTLKILHREVASAHVTYKMFWHEFRRRQPSLQNISIRLDHKPAEFIYFDFCDGISIVDRQTGLLTKTQLLVGVLPFSSKTTAEFVLNQKQPTLFRAIERAFHRFGGLTPYVTVDNLKSAVSKGHTYDPLTNPTFTEFANHWNFATIPARPYKPRDKAAVETAVGVIQRQFFNQVRNQNFFSLQELNDALFKYLEQLNNDPMKDHAQASRNDRFKTEVPVLKPLASEPFELVHWKHAKVHSDCHIQIEKYFYSVPYKYVGQSVRVRIGSHKIEVFSQNSDPIATHLKLVGLVKSSTLDSHYPNEKIAIARFEVKSALKSASLVGPETLALTENLLNGDYPLKFLRRIQGILRLQKTYSSAALEFAAKQAMLFNKKTYPYLKNTAANFHINGYSPKLKLVHTPPLRSPETSFLHSYPQNPTQ